MAMCSWRYLRLENTAEEPEVMADATRKKKKLKRCEIYELI
jgi:hypothetical protein